MKIQFFSWAIPILAISTCAAADTEPTHLSCSENGTAIVYTNGVLTTEIYAKKTLSRIINLVSKSDIDEKSIVVPILAYNGTVGENGDFLEAALQALGEIFKTRNKASSALAKILAEIIPPPTAKIAELVNEMIINLATNEAASLANLTAIYADALRADMKILAVSHSQGGLFINRAYREVFFDRPKWQKNLFGALQIATPVPALSSQGIHKTNMQDAILKTRLSLPGNFPLPPHDPSVHLVVDPPTTEEEARDDENNHHGIITTYMLLPELRHEIERSLKKVARMLGPNCKGCYRGDEFQRGGYFLNSGVMKGGFVSVSSEVDDTATILGDAQVCDDAQVRGGAVVMDNAWIGDRAIVSGNALVMQNARVEEDAQVYGGAIVYGNSRVFGQAQVYGVSLVQDESNIGGAVQFFGETGPTPYFAFPWAGKSEFTGHSPQMAGVAMVKDSLIYGNTVINGSGALIDHSFTGMTTSLVSIFGSPSIGFSSFGGFTTITGSPTILHSDVNSITDIGGDSYIFSSKLAAFGASITNGARIVQSAVYAPMAINSTIENKVCGYHYDEPNARSYVDCIDPTSPDNRYEPYVLNFPPSPDDLP